MTSNGCHSFYMKMTFIGLMEDRGPVCVSKWYKNYIYPVTIEIDVILISASDLKMTYIHLLSGNDVKWMSFNLHENDLHRVYRRQRSGLCQQLIQKLHSSGSFKSDVILMSASDLKVTYIHLLSGNDVFLMSFNLYENDLHGVDWR